MPCYSLEDLQRLHLDLIAFSDSRLLTVERLWVELDAHTDEFRHLLEKTPRNEKSRQSLTAGNTYSHLRLPELEG
jgi:hypothetical protein